ncbi:MAG: replication-associated recombination protein A [Candidatus Lindowbacteria bacterium]|nr:replication-associated recombination protein A [Candidatus Lindowbacteria bacterium]
MDTLFDANMEEHQPLARRMRPRTVAEFAGQTHVLAKGKPLERIIRSGFLSSVILFGPPGTGKTAMAHLLSELFDAEFTILNAVTSGVADIRKVSEAAKDRLSMHGKKTLLFIDEIHRFNKSQQDALLPDVEDGRLILIGATTHNPAFYVTSALGSRSAMIEFKSLTNDEIIALLERALKDKERGLGNFDLITSPDVLEKIAVFSNGDARKALSSLERIAVSLPLKSTMTEEDVEESLGKRINVYDRDQDAHYDTASALIKSLRGSDPDAALYYLAKMIEGGEDPRFIARRMTIFASEDIGNADPRALQLAVAAHQASEFIGMPEARIILGQCAAYLASAPKSNASYKAIDAALDDVRSGRVLDAPDSIKGSGFKGAKDRGRGVGYKYPHDHGGFVKQEYLSERREYYLPTENGIEKRIKERLAGLWGSWPRSGN